MTLKEQVGERMQRLMKQRDELAARSADQLAQLDKQITALKALGKNWDTLTIEQGLVAVEAAGLRVEIKS